LWQSKAIISIMCLLAAVYRLLKVQRYLTPAGGTLSYNHSREEPAIDPTTQNLTSWSDSAADVSEGEMGIEMRMTTDRLLSDGHPQRCHTDSSGKKYPTSSDALARSKRYSLLLWLSQSTLLWIVGTDQGIELAVGEGISVLGHDRDQRLFLIHAVCQTPRRASPRT